MNVQIEDVILEMTPDLRLPVPSFLINKIAARAGEVGVSASTEAIEKKIRELQKEIRKSGRLPKKKKLPQGMRPAAELAKNKPHGTRIKYMGGCRCLPCRAANSNYSVQCDKKKRMGMGNPLVPADRARQHFKKMSRSGVGYKTLARAAGVSLSVAAKIVNGKRKQIRSETERRILNAKPQPIGAALIDAGPTWRLIDHLLSEGFTKTALAKRLGWARAIQLNKHHITARNAERVRQFYNMIMAV